MKFEEAFNEPVTFSDGSIVIDGGIDKIIAVESFSHYFGVDIPQHIVTSNRVRFGFPPETVEDMETGVSCWYSGAGEGKGTKPIWVLGYEHVNKINEGWPVQRMTF